MKKLKLFKVEFNDEAGLFESQYIAAESMTQVIKHFGLRLQALKCIDENLKTI